MCKSKDIPNNFVFRHNALTFAVELMSAFHAFGMHYLHRVRHKSCELPGREKPTKYSSNFCQNVCRKIRQKS